jgi:hypothetical protein
MFKLCLKRRYKGKQINYKKQLPQLIIVSYLGTLKYI